MSKNISKCKHYKQNILIITNHKQKYINHNEHYEQKYINHNKR